MSKTLKARIALAIEESEYSVSGLSKVIDADRTTIYRWVRGAATPHDRNLSDVASATGVSLEWLQTGEGPKQLEEAGDTHSSPSRSDRSPFGPSSDLVPILDHATVEAGADLIGTPVDLEDATGLIWMPRDILRELFGVDDPMRVRRITVTGESMYPTLRPGQKVYVVILDPDERPISSAIYLIDGPYGLSTKRLVFSSIDDGNGDPVYRVTLHSDNEDKRRYPDEIYPLEMFHRDFRLVAHLARVEMAL